MSWDLVARMGLRTLVCSQKRPPESDPCLKCGECLIAACPAALRCAPRGDREMCRGSPEDLSFPF